MNGVRLVACLVLSLPAGWFGGVLYERVPVSKPLFKPFPMPEFSGVYLTIQVLTTALFAFAALRFADAPVGVLAGYLVFFTVCVSLSLIDLDTLRLPDPIVAGALVVSIPLITVVSVIQKDPDLIQHALIGGALYFGFLLLTHLALPRGMGFGDVKLSALLGLYLGWIAASGVSAVRIVLYAMVVGFVGGSILGVILFSFRRKSRAYPFGPFLVAGAVVVILASSQLVT